MIVKVELTNDLDGAIWYSEHKVNSGKANQTVTNVIADTVRQKIEIFNAFKSLNPLTKTNGAHIKVSFHKLDKVSSLMVRQIAKRILDTLGYRNTPFLVYQHFDTKSPHFHIVTVRQNESQIVIKNSNSWLKMKKLSRITENDFNLIPAENRNVTALGLKGPDYIERKLNHDKGLKSVWETMRDEAFESIQGAKSLETFLRRLERRGMKMGITETIQNGRVYYGVSFEMIQAERIGFKELHIPERVRLIPIAFELRVALQQSKETDIIIDIPGYENEAYFGKIRFGKNNIAELCPGSTYLIDFEVARAKASQLGPIFKWNNLKTIVKDSDIELIKKITVKYQNYTWPNFIAHTAEKKLILAIEKRVPGGVLEAISEGASIDLIDPREGLNKEDNAWAKAILRLSINPGKIEVKPNIFDQMMSNYKNEFDHPSGATIEFARLFNLRDWEGCYKLSAQSSDVIIQPDPRIVEKFLEHVDDLADRSIFLSLIEQFHRFTRELAIKNSRDSLEKFNNARRNRNEKLMLEELNKGHFNLNQIDIGNLYWVENSELRSKLKIADTSPFIQRPKIDNSNPGPELDGPELDMGPKIKF